MPPIAPAPGAKAEEESHESIVVEHRGEPGSLKDIPTPQPAPREILVRVTAAGVNPIDWKSRDRRRRQLPFVLGQDFAGVVSATGGAQRRRIAKASAFSALRAITARTPSTPSHPRRARDPIAKIPDAVGDADAAALADRGV